MIAAAEAALLARIRAVLGATVREVESIGNRWDEDTLRRVLLRVPGCWVVFDGGPADRAGEPRLASRWLVYVATGHEGDEERRRLGDTRAIGAYDLLARLVPALHGHVLPDVGTVTVTRVDNLFTGRMEKQGVAVYGIELALPLVFALAVPDTVTPFETFHADLDIEAHETAAEHQKWLAEPPDQSTSKPDAADTVALPQ